MQLSLPPSLPYYLSILALAPIALAVSQQRATWGLNRRRMASADRSRGTMAQSPGGEDGAPPGRPMTVGQRILDHGAVMMQSLKPIKQMHQHVCTFALYTHDMSRQIETHHYITRLNQDFLQCAVYDSDDSFGRLIGKAHTPYTSLPVGVFLGNQQRLVWQLTCNIPFILIHFSFV